MKKAFYIIVSCTFVLICFISCKKSWLDAKSDKSLLVPTSLEDMQSLLYNTTYFNTNQPSLGELSSDDYYILYNKWQTLATATQQNAYLWAQDIYVGGTGFDWNYGYSSVFYSNNILDGLSKIPIDNANQTTWNKIQSSVLFFRSVAFFNLAQLFAKPYTSNTASLDLGIPLKLSSDINERVSRASVQQTYDRIISDIILAIPGLPNSPQVNATQPSKPAAYAMLARVYLSMEKYDKALLYADSCLQIYSTLIDYNNYLPPATPFSFPLYQPEQIIYGEGYGYTSIFSNSSPTWVVDSTLFQSYSANDLRRSLFFVSVNGFIAFKGSYTRSVRPYTGIATDEVYLIRAECNARLGNTANAMADLNTLLRKRWKKDPITGLSLYVDQTATDANDALSKILIERRKELIHRGLRWTDLRRLNKDPRFAITLTRILNGQTYTLSPNDPKYVLPIPDDEINLTGIQQNPR